MSTYYNFMVEAFYDGKWHNIDYQTQGIDGTLHHQYLDSFSHTFVDLLDDFIHSAYSINFEDLAENTQELLTREYPHGNADYSLLSKYFVAGDLKALTDILAKPYMNEGYVTRNQKAAFEAEEIEEIYDVLTAHELLQLPEEARREYVLYQWDYQQHSRERIRRMVDKINDQLSAFNRSIPYRRDVPYDNRTASKIRIIYFIT